MFTIRIETKLEHSTLKRPLPATAFKPGDVYRVEFPAGMSLYKVTQADAVTASRTVPVGPSGFVTPWWFSYETVTGAGPDHRSLRINGIADVVERTRGSAARTLPEYLRARGAVCLDWNKMTHLLVVTLRRQAVGIVGTCSGQPVLDDASKAPVVGVQVADVENVRFIGGEQQLYVPGLRAGDVHVHSFGPVP